MSETSIILLAPISLKRKRDWCSTRDGGDAAAAVEHTAKRTKSSASHLSAGTVHLPSSEFTFKSSSSTCSTSASSTPTRPTSSCRLEHRPSPLSQTSTAAPTSTTTTPDSTTTTTTTTESPTESGHSSINELEDSLTACSINSKLHPTTTASQGKVDPFGFDTTLSNVQYGLSKAKPYRFTSPLSPQPEKRERPKSRRHRAKATSLLKSTLHRNYILSLRKRCPDLFFRPRCPPVPQLDAADEDDDEFDDDEDDELIDDFDCSVDSQVDDIVNLYSRGSTPEPDMEEIPTDTMSIAESLLALAPRTTKVLQPSNVHNLPTLNAKELAPKPMRVCIVNA